MTDRPASPNGKTNRAKTNRAKTNRAKTNRAKTKRPALSVLMPAYNAAEFIRESVESILRQSFTDFELLIADNGSSDATRGVLDEIEDPRIRRLDVDHHRTYLSSCNSLFEEVRGSYFAFQDADDVSEPRRFELQLQALAEEPDAAFCTTDYLRVDRKGRFVAARSWPTDYNAIRSDLGQRLRICKASMVARTEILRTVPHYRTYFEGKGGEDIDWVYRILETYTATHLKESLYRYRQHHSAAKSMHRARIRYQIMELVEELRSQRRESNEDWIDRMDADRLDAFMRRLDQPFVDDPALIHRLEARDMMRFGEYRGMARKVVQAIAANPTQVENYFGPAQDLLQHFGEKISRKTTPQPKKERPS